MAYETLVTVYDTQAHADAAVKALRAAGFNPSDINAVNKARLDSNKAIRGANLSDPAIWHRLFGKNVAAQDAKIYAQTVEKGGSVISLRVPANEAAHATSVLESQRPANIQAARTGTPGHAAAAAVEPKAAAVHIETVQKKIEPLAGEKVAAVQKAAEALPGTLRLAEEHLEVGKERVETGRARVRRFVTEKEVAADVTLHKEHAELIRNALNHAVNLDDVNWADEEIEIIETAETPIVKKTVRIVEEVSLRKVRTDRVETVRDKVRRHQVAIERLGADGKIIPGAGFDHITAPENSAKTEQATVKPA